MEGQWCDINHCVCGGQNPVCEYQEWLNDSDRIRDEQMDTDNGTDAEEIETDEEMASDESNFDDEVGFFLSSSCSWLTIYFR